MHVDVIAAALSDATEREVNGRRGDARLRFAALAQTSWGSHKFIPFLLLMVAAFRMSDFWSTHLVVMRHESTLLFINIAAAGVLLWWICSGWTRDAMPTADQVAWFALSVSAVTFGATALTAWALTRRHVARQGTT